MTSSNRRQRQLARAKFERQQARRAEREDKARVR
ncbi:MAG: peptidylprolyl isomerase, partial [Actinobacteria bacterium]|nr:peptidylprolyl isomerase [Actinomycetota bacterium]